MKKITKIIMSAAIGLPLLFSQEASAKEFRSNHYHRGNQKRVVRQNHDRGHRRAREVHVHRRPVVVQRHVHYRPYYRPVIAHYHREFFDPCYETYHPHGVYWNVNVGTGGFGVGIQSGW